MKRRTSSHALAGALCDRARDAAPNLHLHAQFNELPTAASKLMRALHVTARAPSLQTWTAAPVQMSLAACLAAFWERRDLCVARTCTAGRLRSCHHGCDLAERVAQEGLTPPQGSPVTCSLGCLLPAHHGGRPALATQPSSSARPCHLHPHSHLCSEP